MAVEKSRSEIQPAVDLERFSDQGRQALALAEEEARGLNHSYIGTEHLLLGLLRLQDGLAASVLRGLGVGQERARAAVEHIIGRGETDAAEGEIRLTPRAVAATALAVSEAGRMQRAFNALVGPEHLLLGLLREGEGIAAGVLESFGLTLDKVRAHILEAIVTQQPSSPRTLAAKAASSYVGQHSHADGIDSSPRTLAAQAASPATRSNVITCRIDGRDLDAIDALVEAGVRATRSEAASWLIHAGIEANKTLLDTVYGTVAEIRRLREVAQSLAQQVAMGAAPAEEPPA